MCMICKGLERGKFTPEEAAEKLEEFVDLDLLDEDHQEKVEALISEMEEEEYYWSNATRDARYDYDNDKDYYDDYEDLDDDELQETYDDEESGD